MKIKLTQYPRRGTDITMMKKLLYLLLLTFALGLFFSTPAATAANAGSHSKQNATASKHKKEKKHKKNKKQHSKSQSKGAASSVKA
jgi:hypothetical protein